MTEINTGDVVELLAEHIYTTIEGWPRKYPKGELASVVKCNPYQVVLLFLDGNRQVLSPPKVKRVGP